MDACTFTAYSPLAKVRYSMCTNLRLSSLEVAALHAALDDVVRCSNSWCERDKAAAALPAEFDSFKLCFVCQSVINIAAMGMADSLDFCGMICSRRKSAV